MNIEDAIKNLREKIPVDFIQEIQKEEIEGCNSDEILSPADVGFVVNPVKVKF